jgi:hypothetical protein
MSAAATAAGYLYAHGKVPVSGRNAQADKEAILRQGRSEPVKPARTPKIEYRKRRSYPSPGSYILG